MKNICVLVVLIIAANASAQSYSIKELGTLGGNTCQATAVNNLGEVSGSASIPTFFHHPFLYRNDEMIDLGTLGGGGASVAGMNDSTQIIGTSATSGSLHAFLWEDGQMIDLNPFLGSTSSGGYGINNSTQIVGRSDWNLPSAEGFLYESDGTLTPLGSLGGSPTPRGINEVGQIVGYYLTDQGALAFLYSNGKMISLGTLDGGESSSARDINDKGQVVGNSNTETIYNQAFLYTDGVMVGLETPDGFSSNAYAINNSGVVVGTITVVTSSAVIWEDGIMTELIDLIPENSEWERLIFARDINEVGQIVGNGKLFDNEQGHTRCFLLTPCPSDFNQDGMVNAPDLKSLLANWGPCIGCSEDLNNDDVVNPLDLALLLGSWGECG